MRVYIGYDEREKRAAHVACSTLQKTSAIDAELLDSEKLSAHGLLNRVADHRGGQDYDLVSNAKKSTRFAISRFLVPLLCQQGFALFTDCDVVFMRDIAPMLYAAQADAGRAVYVVKHRHEEKRLDGLPSEQWKMVNQEQLYYPRKNWSSVMLFDCGHQAHRRLSLWDINNRPGRDLHALYWLHDSEIGDLPTCWNWLVNVQPEPVNVGIAHFTLGGPWLSGWHGAEHDVLWLAAEANSGVA